MAVASIITKTRDALVEYLTATITGTSNIYDEKGAADKEAPNVSCGAENAQEDPDMPQSGNFFVDATVKVKTRAIDGKSGSDTLETEVFTVLESDDLGDQLSAAVDDYVVMGLAGNAEFTEEEDGDCWIATWRRRIYCAASDI